MIVTRLLLQFFASLTGCFSMGLLWLDPFTGVFNKVSIAILMLG